MERFKKENVFIGDKMKEKVLERKTNSEITRRDFIKNIGTGVAISSAASVLQGCATTSTNYHLDESGRLKRPLNPQIKYEYEQHFKYFPPGIDATAGFGAPIVNVEGLVWQAKDFSNGAIRLLIQNDLGFLIQLSSLSQRFKQTGDSVELTDIVGLEGIYAPFSEAPGPHLHIDVRLQPFAELFIKNPVIYKVQEGESYIMENPHKNSLKRNLLTSITDGTSPTKKLLKEGEDKFNAIGDEFPRTELGWFINNSKGLRFYPRTLGAYQMFKDGRVTNEGLKKRLLDSFRWLIEARFLLSPYPNYEHRDMYSIPKASPNKEVLGESLWNIVRAEYVAGNWKRVISALEEYSRVIPTGLTPTFGGDLWVERNFGVAYAKLGDYEKAVVHSLMAQGLVMLYKLDDNQVLNFHRALYTTLMRSYQHIAFGSELDRARIVDNYRHKLMNLK